MYGGIHVYFSGEFSLVTNTWAVKKCVFPTKQFLREKLDLRRNFKFFFFFFFFIASKKNVTEKNNGQVVNN